MPGEALEWEQVKDAETQIKQIIENNPEEFAHINPDQIAVVWITNKERPKGTKWDAKMDGVKAPVSLFCDRRYVIHFYKNVWEKFTSAQRAYVLSSMLLRIPLSDGEDPDGSVLPEDLKGMRKLVKRLGVDAMDDPNLPDLSKEKQILAIE